MTDLASLGIKVDSSQVVAATKSLNDFSGQARGAASSTKQATTASEALKLSYTKLAGAIAASGIAYQTLMRAMSEINSLFRKGFDAVEQYNTSIASLSALVLTFTKAHDNMKLADRWKEAVRYSTEMVPILERIAARTLLSGSETIALANAFARAGVFLDATNQKQIEGFMTLSNTIPLMTQGQAIMLQINQEIRGLMGGGNLANSMLLQTLQAINPEVKTQLETWRAEGTVLEHLGELLAGFNSATSMLENQWMAVKSTIDTTVTQTLRAGMQVVYADIINLIKSMDAGLQENKGTIAAGIVVAWESVKTVAASVWNIISGLRPILSPLVDITGMIAYGWGGILAVLEPVSKVVGNILATGIELVKVFGNAVLALGALINIQPEVAKTAANEAINSAKKVAELTKENYGILTEGLGDAIVKYNNKVSNALESGAKAVGAHKYNFQAIDKAAEDAGKEIADLQKEWARYVEEGLSDSERFHSSLTRVNEVFGKLRGTFSNSKQAADEYQKAVQGLFSRVVPSEYIDLLGGIGKKLEEARFNAAKLTPEIEALYDKFSKLDWSTWTKAMEAGTPESEKFAKVLDDINKVFAATKDLFPSMEEAGKAYQRVITGLVSGMSGYPKELLSLFDSLGEMVKATGGDVEKLKGYITETFTSRSGIEEGIIKDIRTLQDEIDKTISKSQDAMMSLEDMQEMTAEGLRKIYEKHDIGETYAQSMEKVRDATDRMKKDIKKKVESHNEEVYKQYEHFLERVENHTSDFFYDLFKNGLTSVGNFFGKIRDMFIRLLADIAAQAILRPIVLPIVTSVTSVLGLTGTASATSGLGSLGSASNLGIGAAGGAALAGSTKEGFFSLGGIGSLIPNLQEKIAGYSLDVASYFLGQETGVAVGNAILGLSESAFAGWSVGIGKFISNLLSGKDLGEALASAATTGLGAYGGAALGNLIAPGIGGLIGAGLGGIIGSLFGGIFGAKENKFTLTELVGGGQTSTTFNPNTGFAALGWQHPPGGNEWYHPIANAYAAAIETVQQSFNTVVKDFTSKLPEDLSKKILTTLSETDWAAIQTGVSSGRWYMSNAQGVIESVAQQYADALSKTLSQVYYNALASYVEEKGPAGILGDEATWNVLTDKVQENIRTAFKGIADKIRAGSYDEAQKSLEEINSAISDIASAMKPIKEIIDTEGLTDYEKQIRNINIQFDQYGAQLAAVGVDLEKYTDLEKSRGIALKQVADQQKAAIESLLKAANDTIATAGMTDLEKQIYDVRQKFADLTAQLKAAGASAEQLADADLARTIELNNISLQNAVSATDAAYSSLENAINKQKEAIQTEQAAIQERINSLESIFNILDSAIKNLRGNTEAMMSTASAQALIRNAIVSGQLPEEKDLQNAIDVLTRSLVSSNYSSSFEYQKARLVLAGNLEKLKTVSDAQLLTEKNQLSDSNKQIALLDDQLGAAKDQLDAMRGIDTSVKSVEIAIRDLQATMAQEAGVRAIITQMPKTPTTPPTSDLEYISSLAAQQVSGTVASTAYQQGILDAHAAAAENAVETQISNLYQQYLGRVPDVGGLEYWANQVETGFATIADVTSGIANSLEAQARAVSVASQNQFIQAVNSVLGLSTDITARQSGGYTRSGLVLVGEGGPELVNFRSPGMVYNSGQTKDILGGGSDLAVELKQLREENKAHAQALASMQLRMVRLLERWDGNGIPEERAV